VERTLPGPAGRHGKCVAGAFTRAATSDGIDELDVCYEMMERSLATPALYPRGVIRSLWRRRRPVSLLHQGNYDVVTRKDQRRGEELLVEGCVIT
jgi:hypothetical protein